MRLLLDSCPSTKCELRMIRYLLNPSLSLVVLVCALGPLTGRGDSAELIGEVVDDESGRALPARVYMRGSDGKWLFVKSASPHGSALPYQEQWVPIPNSVERHTTISAHPFSIQLSPGKYFVRVHHGKEFLPQHRTIEVTGADAHVTFRLKRVINMARLGWYSGETHVHRRVRELSNVMLAEDLNVAFPVTYWTTDGLTRPNLEPSSLRGQGPSPMGPRKDFGSKPIRVDATHVVFPRNTEYEVFNMGPRGHVLGAVFILNHKSVFAQTAPPIADIARQAHREGALLDLDKHSWPWSMMLVPIAKVDLYELANNSVWRTNFGFRRSSVAPADYMNVEMVNGLMTERGWLQFGFENYYSLLNCGFSLKPTAGTASGVHPVPLGYSRVYVHLDGEFNGRKWIEGLRRGTSFVTTGPLILAKLEERLAGHIFSQERQAKTYRMTGRVFSRRPLQSIDVIVNGQIVRQIDAEPRGNETDGFVSTFSAAVAIAESSWIAVRCFEPHVGRRVRFAHTAPWQIHVNKEPVRPRREQVEYLIKRMQDEIARSRGVLSGAALKEFEEALAIYQELARTAHE